MQREIDFNVIDISRGGNNTVSQLAHEKLKPHKKNQRQEVLELIDDVRCTMEIAEIMGVPLHKISGRFTEIKAVGKIRGIGRKEYNGSYYTVYEKNK